MGTIADVTIFDRASGRELPVYWHDGRAYVVGQPGNEYQVVVKNRNGGDILAIVSVDGLNAMTGETASAGQSGYVLSPWSRMDVRGWRKSVDETAAFYFTTLGDSYAARTDRPSNVGVIGVAVFQRKYVPPPESSWSAPAAPAESMRVPAQDSNMARAQPRRAARTGHGRREESHITWVDFERATERPVETISIYYDSYRNLVAMGVVRQPAPQRNPNPFPASFAPDPWR